MKHFPSSILFIGLFLVVSLNSLSAQDSTKTDKEKESVEHKQHFIDNDGDGYNDNAPDHDGDGIPNGLDADWQTLNKKNRNRQRFVDLNGDGINDNFESEQNTEKNEEQNLREQKRGSSLDNRSIDDQQKQQRQQRGKQ